MSRSYITFFKTLFTYLWTDDWRMRMRIVLVVAIALLIIVLNILIPIMLGRAVQIMTDKGTQAAVLVPMIIAGYGVFYILSNFLLQLRDAIIFRVLERGVRKISLDLFDHLHRLSLRFHLSVKSGAIVQAVDRAQIAFPDLVWAFFLYIVPAIIELVSAAVVFGRLYGGVYALVFVGVYLVYAIYTIASAQWATRYQRYFNTMREKVSSWIVDSLTNFEAVRYFSSYHHEHRLCDQLLAEREIAASKRWMSSFLGVYGGGMLIIGFSVLGFTLFLALKVMSGALAVGAFVTIHTYFLQEVESLSNNFAYMVRRLREGFVDMEYVFSLFRVSPDVVDRPVALPLIRRSPHVEFCDVSFSYDHERVVLDSVSFEIPAGRTVALVGSTGSGKSTIARLLFRFYDLSSGAILFDKKDIRDVSLESLRSLIGIVPQDITLFDATLYDNLVYGQNDVTPQELDFAVHHACLKRYIDELPQGYQTVVGSRGLAVSGGEKQRIAIARVLLKKPLLYIFDEPTSALDAHTQHIVQCNLRAVSAGCTTLIIAHRLSTVVHADEIIVLDRGRIVERGSHTMLLGYDGLYAGLWQQQSAG